MEEFSEEQISKMLKFYQDIGLSTNDFLKVDNVLDIYRILGIVPEFDENGNRKLTPYEILGVPPIIVNGREIPIVFAIKNKTKRTKKIGKIDGEIVSFVYKNKRVRDKDSVLEELKKQYIQALIAGDEELAEQFLKLIDEYTGGRSVDVLISFYDYTKFYRRMKKQLMIDLFNHFFLMFMMQTNLAMKEGVFEQGKLYKAYRDDDRIKRMEEIDFKVSKDLLGKKGGPRLSKIRVSRGDEEISRTKVVAKPSKEPVSQTKPLDSEKKEMPKRQERKGLFGFLNRRSKNSRFRKYDYDPLEQIVDGAEQVVEQIVEGVVETAQQVVEGAAKAVVATGEMVTDALAKDTFVDAKNPSPDKRSERKKSKDLDKTQEEYDEPQQNMGLNS